MIADLFERNHSVRNAHAKERREIPDSHSIRRSVSTERNESQSELLHRVLDLLARSLVDSESLREGRRVLSDVGEGGVEGVDELDGGCDGANEAKNGKRRESATNPTTRGKKGFELLTSSEVSSRRVLVGLHDGEPFLPRDVVGLNGSLSSLEDGDGLLRSHEDGEAWRDSESFLGGSDDDLKGERRRGRRRWGVSFEGRRDRRAKREEDESDEHRFPSRRTCKERNEVSFEQSITSHKKTRDNGRLT